MRALKNALLASVFVLGSVGVASAADLSHSSPEAAPEAPYAAAPYHSNSGFYVRGDFGWNWIGGGTKDEESILLGAGVGYRFNDMLRADIRFDYGFDYSVTLNNVKTGYDVGSVTANAYADIPVGFALSPYVGVGGGYGWVTVDNLPGTADSFVGALMGGVAYNVSDAVALDVGYRFRHWFASGGGDDHSVTAGIRYSF